MYSDLDEDYVEELKMLLQADWISPKGKKQIEDELADYLSRHMSARQRRLQEKTGLDQRQISDLFLASGF